jgi:tetratricopeptide (TPR) repeat protein
VLSERFLRRIDKIQRPEEAQRYLRSDRCWRPEVVEGLLRRADKLVSLTPKAALGIAEIALTIVTRLRVPSRELQAHALCSVATAQRYLGKLREAESHFYQAEKLSQGGSASLTAMIARQKSLLCVDQGDLAFALRLARKAVKLDRSTGIFPTKSLLVEGIVVGFRNEITASEACFTEVLEHEDPSSDDYLFATNNLVRTILKRPLLVAEILEARKTIRRLQERIRGIRETPVRYTFWYLEGLLHGLMEEYRLAAKHIEQGRVGFLRMGMMPDYARLSVDLVDVLVKKGDLDKAQQVIQEAAGHLSASEESKSLAEIFRLAESEPMESAVGLLHARIN